MARIGHVAERFLGAAQREDPQWQRVDSAVAYQAHDLFQILAYRHRIAIDIGAQILDAVANARSTFGRFRLRPDTLLADLDEATARAQHPHAGGDEIGR